MELLLFWGIPVIAAIIGFRRMFYSAFTWFLCFAFAAYLGMWSEGLFAALFGFLPQGFRPAVAVSAAAVIFAVVLFLAFNALNPQNKIFAFPPLVERVGGALFGLLSGMILIRFIALIVCLTPYKAELPFGIETAPVQARAVGGIMALTRGINLFTLQFGRNATCRERLDDLLIAADEAAADRVIRKAEGPIPGTVQTPPPEKTEKSGTLRNAMEQKELREQEVKQ